MTSLTAPENGKIIVAPSILSADLWQLGSQVQTVEQAEADWLHVDIMDGHFVPNLSFGPSVVKSLKGRTTLPLDVHLMVQTPSRFVEPFAKAGADILTVHIEAAEDIKQVLLIIKKLGIKAGVSIKPKTDPQLLTALLPYVDLILVMTVEPGFGGQGFLPQSPQQIQAVKQLVQTADHPIYIEVDGGINAQTAAIAAKAGAQVFVAGNAVFAAQNPARAVADIRRAAQQI